MDRGEEVSCVLNVTACGSGRDRPEPAIDRMSLTYLSDISHIMRSYTH